MGNAPSQENRATTSCNISLHEKFDEDLFCQFVQMKNRAHLYPEKKWTCSKNDVHVCNIRNFQSEESGLWLFFSGLIFELLHARFRIRRDAWFLDVHNFSKKNTLKIRESIRQDVTQWLFHRVMRRWSRCKSDVCTAVLVATQREKNVHLLR